MKLRHELYIIGGLVFVVVVLAYLGHLFFAANPTPLLNWGAEVSPRMILSLMVVAVALITFYGFMGLGVDGTDSTLSKSDIRLAIVISTLTSYFVIFGTVSFFDEGSEPGQLSALTSQFVTHFTTIVGVVIAFYFGATAYEAVHGSSSQTADVPQSKEKTDETHKSTPDNVIKESAQVSTTA